jgi:hypothetical protein
MAGEQGAGSGLGGSRVLVVIVSYNTRELLRRCLQTLLGRTRSALSVWVWDNASRDGSAQMVQREFPSVHVVASRDNVGFAAGNNGALRRAGAGAPYVLLLNPDTEVEEGAVDALADHLDRDAACGAVGVQLLNPDGTPQRSFDRFWFTHPLRSFVRNHVPGLRERGVAGPAAEVVAVDWVIGACLMLRGEALRQVGLLDESFRIYGEEVDLQYRLREAGWGVALLPRVHVLHHGGQSTRQVFGPMQIEEHRGRYLLLRKHASAGVRALYIGKALAELAVGVGRGLGQGPGDVKGRVALLAAHLRPSFYRGRLMPVPPWPG